MAARYEDTQLSVLNIVDRSIIADRLTEELATSFAVRAGPPMVLRLDNGPEFISQALQQFCSTKIGISQILPGTPWKNGHIELFNNRLRK